jgi:hypothetical protein
MAGLDSTALSGTMIDEWLSGMRMEESEPNLRHCPDVYLNDKAR